MTDETEAIDRIRAERGQREQTDIDRIRAERRERRGTNERPRND